LIFNKIEAKPEPLKKMLEKNLRVLALREKPRRYWEQSDLPLSPE
jgi:preprotein translocase subunit Sss1